MKNSVGRLVLLCLLGAIAGGLPAAATPLDDYVAAPDANYSWQVMATYPRTGYTDYIVYMKSQEWLTTAEVNRPLWEHWLIVTKPDTVSHDTGMLVIGSGNWPQGQPSANDGNLTQMALETNSVVAQLRQVPSQPLTFVGGPTGTEDSLIAFGWARFLETGDPKWLMRLPMTKAAVRAMDTVTALLASPAGGSITVNKYVVTGASKRGWTTWTTAAVDPRVVGCVPVVIDLLNLETSFQHHYDALGRWSVQVYDYQVNGIMDAIKSPEFNALCEIVEPFRYRHRLTMPKLIINGSQDEFFLPDSSQFYFGRLEGEKHLAYVPNQGHGGSTTWNLLSRVRGWYWALLNNVPRPEVTWVKRHDGSLVIDTHGNIPTSATLWTATNATKRDFNMGYYGPMYSSSALAPVSPGQYVASVPLPAQGWKAFFVEFTFATGGPAPFTFTTEISVVPDVLPYGPQYGADAATELLDAAFYTEGGATRHAIGGSFSNSGKMIAFWGVDGATNETNLYVANVGRPSSWRRVNEFSLGQFPPAPIVWSADDSALIVGTLRLHVPAPGETENFVGFGYVDGIHGMTGRASNNWAVGVWNGNIVALPVNDWGDEDTSREYRIVADFDEGPNVDWVTISADGSTIAFCDYHANVASADSSKIYVIRNADEIINAPYSDISHLSNMAVRNITDDNVAPIRTTESDNFAGFPSLSGDGTLVVFDEDWSNTYRHGAWQAALAGSDFDVMVSYADGYEADQRLALAGTQAFASLSRNGMRVTYSEPVGGVFHLFARPLPVSTRASSTNSLVAKSTVGVQTRQQFESDGSATLDVPAGTSINMPDTQESVAVSTPVLPEEYNTIPAGVSGLPVVRVLGPAGTTLTGPATLTLKYTDAEVRNLYEAQLRVYLLDTTDGLYHEFGGTVTHDTSANTFSFTPERLGTYAIGGPGILDDDRDGIPNDLEALHGLDPYLYTDATEDADGDGLHNGDELGQGTDISDPDTDDDGLSDGDEAHTHGTNPTAADSDSDGLSDGDEVSAHHTNPLAADSDGDGVNDGTEVNAGTDPNDPQDVPGMPLGTPAAVLLAAALAGVAGRRLVRARSARD